MRQEPVYRLGPIRAETCGVALLCDTQQTFFKDQNQNAKGVQE